MEIALWILRNPDQRPMNDHFHPGTVAAVMFLLEKSHSILGIILALALVFVISNVSSILLLDIL